MRHTLFWLATALALLVPNFLILQKERLRASDQTVLLELAPVDPRSLIQGDYMILFTEVERHLRRLRPKARDGHVVVTLDDHRVAHFQRVHQPRQPLKEGERLLKYRVRKHQYRVGANAFFFQEGHAKYYNRARYGKYKLAKSGKLLLLGLLNKSYQPLGPPKDRPSPQRETPRRR